MPIVTCTPQKHNRRAGILSVLTLAAAMFLYAGAGLITTLRYIPQLIALALGAFGIYLMIRYCLTDFRYELHDNNLVVIKIVGKNEMMVCDLTLGTGCALLPKNEEAEIHKIFERIDRTHNYVVNFQPDTVYSYLYRDADYCNAILLEADDAFIAEMRTRMRQATASENENP